MHIYLLKINNIKSEDFRFLLNFIPKCKKNKVMKYHKRMDKIRALLAEILIRQKLSEHLGIQSKEIKIGYNNFGKPYLLNFDNIYFNISHSHEYIVLVYSTSNIGIDIEYLKLVDMQMIIKDFAEEEKDYILHLPSHNQIRGFYEVWTRKESFLKNIGVGLSQPLNSFSVVDSTNRALSDSIKHGGLSYYFSNFYKLNNYIVTICSEEEYKSITIVKLSFNELSKKLI